MKERTRQRVLRRLESYSDWAGRSDFLYACRNKDVTVGACLIGLRVNFMAFNNSRSVILIYQRFNDKADFCERSEAE